MQHTSSLLNMAMSLTIAEGSTPSSEQSRIVNILFRNSSAGWVMGTQVPSRLGQFLPQWETEPHRLPTISQGIICLDAAGLSRLPHLRKDGSFIVGYCLEGLKERLSEVMRLCD
jgi:hypothetical protein